MRDDPDLPVLSQAALCTLREDQPSAGELQAAYARFARRPRRRARGLLVSRWLVAGVVMGLGIAFGAQAVEQRLSPTPPPEALAPTPLAARKAVHLRAPLPNLPSTLEASAEPVSRGSNAKPARIPSSASTKGLAAKVDEAPADSAVWAKAAEGLRNNDLAETQSALVTLENGGSNADREAARLIRAQLMLHQGDERGGRALLQDLANNAQTGPVRAKARSLLAQTAKTNSALNVAPSGT